MSSLRVAQLALDMVTAVAPLHLRIKRHNKSLADQLVRAASSVALNIAEGEYSDPGTKRSRFFSAAGSANETRMAVRVAVALRYFPAEEAAAVLALRESIIATLWKLTR